MGKPPHRRQLLALALEPELLPPPPPLLLLPPLLVPLVTRLPQPLPLLLVALMLLPQPRQHLERPRLLLPPASA